MLVYSSARVKRLSTFGCLSPALFARLRKKSLWIDPKHTKKNRGSKQLNKNALFINNFWYFLEIFHQWKKKKKLKFLLKHIYNRDIKCFSKDNEEHNRDSYWSSKISFSFINSSKLFFFYWSSLYTKLPNKMPIFYWDRIFVLKDLPCSCSFKCCICILFIEMYWI